MKTVCIFIFSTFLLCACAQNAVPSTTSESIQVTSNSDSSSIENQIGEIDPELRQCWASLSANRGVLYEDGKPFMAFYGEADETLEGGYITLGKQGVFSYDESEDGIEVDDYQSSGYLSALRGLRVLSRLGPESFIDGENGYELHSPATSPFAAHWLSLISENRSQSSLSSLILKKNGEDIKISTTYFAGEEIEETRTVEIKKIGKVSYQMLQNFVDYPFQVPNRSSFDSKILEHLTSWTGAKDSLPFPSAATSLFADSLLEDTICMRQYGEDIRESYASNLSGSGFHQEAGSYLKTIKVKDFSCILTVTMSLEGQDTEIQCQIKQPSIEAASFQLLNAELADSPFPSFPYCSNLFSVAYERKEKEGYEIEVVFKTVDAGTTYFEDDYWPILESHQFLDSGMRFASDAQYRFKRGKNTIQIFCGETAPKEGFPFHIVLSVS